MRECSASNPCCHPVTVSICCWTALFASTLHLPLLAYTGELILLKCGCSTNPASKPRNRVKLRGQVLAPQLPPRGSVSQPRSEKRRAGEISRTSRPKATSASPPSAILTAPTATGPAPSGAKISAVPVVTHRTITARTMSRFANSRGVLSDRGYPPDSRSKLRTIGSHNGAGALARWDPSQDKTACARYPPAVHCGSLGSTAMRTAS